LLVAGVGDFWSFLLATDMKGWVSLGSRILILGWISWGEEGEDFAALEEVSDEGEKKNKRSFRQGQK
jgi:hypothetical protein